MNNLDISVVIATHNRDGILEETLQHMVRLDRAGINIEFVIVDNNSTDRTKDVIEKFSEILPIRYLFEARTGQNFARNRAVLQPGLGEIVAFTDDDVVPAYDWLKVIFSVSKHFSEYNVFGGRIYVIWPKVRIPAWAQLSDVRGLAFAEHDYSKSERLYNTGLKKYPFSGNFWIRRKVFEMGEKFDDSIAWCPGNRILATETGFFQELSQEGYEFFYTPKAVVGHRITKEQLSLTYLIKRAYSGGRGAAYLQPVCRENLLKCHPVFWRLIRMGAILRLGGKMLLALVPLTFFKKPQMAVYSVRWLGYNVELLNMADNCRKIR